MACRHELKRCAVSCLPADLHVYSGQVACDSIAYGMLCMLLCCGPSAFVAAWLGRCAVRLYPLHLLLCPHWPALPTLRPLCTLRLYTHGL